MQEPKKKQTKIYTDKKFPDENQRDEKLRDEKMRDEKVWDEKMPDEDWSWHAASVREVVYFLINIYLAYIKLLLSYESWNRLCLRIFFY